MKKLFTGTVQAGKLILNDPALFEKTYKQLEGKEIELTIGPKRKSRTKDQNSYYWLLVKMSGDFLGFFPDEMHFTFRREFLSLEGNKLTPPRSTTDLSTIEFKDYIEAIKILMAEQGCYLPEPNEVGV